MHLHLASETSVSFFERRRRPSRISDAGGLRRSPREVSGGREEKERRGGRGEKAPQAHYCKTSRRDSGVLKSLKERWKRVVLRQ